MPRSAFGGLRRAAGNAVRSRAVRASAWSLAHARRARATLPNRALRLAIGSVFGVELAQARPPPAALRIPVSTLECQRLADVWALAGRAAVPPRLDAARRNETDRGDARRALARDGGRDTVSLACARRAGVAVPATGRDRHGLPVVASCGCSNRRRLAEAGVHFPHGFD